MKIILAEHIGFCSGVKRAVLEIVKELNKTDEDILVLGPLIHNPQAIAILSSRGLKTIEDINEIDDKVVAVRTHGIPVDKLRLIKSKSKRVINLTCPKVASIHSIVKKHSSAGALTIIIGDKNHAEMNGIVSYASGNYHIISDPGDIDTIPSSNKYIVVAQTTVDKNFFNDVIKIIEETLANVTIFNTICDSTHNRQNDLTHAISSGIDAIVVVGGIASANTKRLALIGKKSGIKTFHIETESELNAEDFENVNSVLLSAGASTPNWIVNNTLEKLYEIKFIRKARLVNFFKLLAEFIFRTNIVAALSASFMTALIQTKGNPTGNPMFPLITAFFVFSMYTINNFFQKDLLQQSNQFKYRIYIRHKNLLVALGSISYIASLICIVKSKPIIITFYCLILAAGTIYSLPKIQRFITQIPLKLIRRLYLFRSLPATIGWSIVSILLPFIESPYQLKIFIPIFTLLFSIIAMRNIIMDLIAFQGDMILGMEIFPTLLGKKLSNSIFIILIFLSSASIIAAVSMRSNYVYCLFFINLVYNSIIFKNTMRLNYFYPLKYEIIADVNLILFSIIALSTIWI